MSGPVPRVGDVIAGKYRIERQLGEGGMAVVYAATHLALGRSVALKFVRPWALGENEVRERFMREAHATFSLRSEHAVRMLDLGELPSGDLFLVMELLEGQNLAEVIQQRAPLPEAEAGRFVRQACDAIGEAHALGIIHRDLKPANLFLTTTHTGKLSVKVLDFGLAKIAGTTGHGSVAPLTGIATTLGTPKYMAPEQWERSARVDSRADIYSLGVILFQLLTGKVPHEELPLDERLRLILAGAVPSPRGLRPEIGEMMARVVMRCLRPLPEERFATAQQLAEALAHAEATAEGIARPRPAMLTATGITAVVPDAIRRAVQREVDVKEGFGSAAAVSVSPNNLAAPGAFAAPPPITADHRSAPTRMDVPAQPGPALGSTLSSRPANEAPLQPQTDRMEHPTVMQPSVPSSNVSDARSRSEGVQPRQPVSTYGAHANADAPMSGMSQAYAPTTAAPRKKSSGAGIAIAAALAGLCVIVVGAVAVVLYLRSSPPADVAPASSVAATSAAPILAPSAAVEPLPALTQTGRKKATATAVAAKTTAGGGGSGSVSVAAITDAGAQTAPANVVADRGFEQLVNPLGASATPAPAPAAADAGVSVISAGVVTAAPPASGTPPSRPVPPGKSKKGIETNLGF